VLFLRKSAFPPQKCFPMDRSTFTITYGDCAENHAGMQKIGDIRDGGLTNGDIRNAAALFREAVGDDAVADFAFFIAIALDGRVSEVVEI